MWEITESIALVSLFLQKLYMYVNLIFCLNLQMRILVTLTLIGLKLADKKEASCLFVVVTNGSSCKHYLFTFSVFKFKKKKFNIYGNI